MLRSAQANQLCDPHFERSDGDLLTTEYDLRTQTFQQRWHEFQAKLQGRWVQTPTRLQMEYTECGATALGIILQHYGRYIPLTQLRESCGFHGWK